jgi:serine/threonine protein kinase
VSKKDKLTDELKINKMIQSLENSDQWAVLFTDTCKHPPNYKQTYQYDKDILSCIDKFNITEDEFNKYRKIISGPFGGISMNTIHQLPITRRQLVTSTQSNLKKIYQYLKPLFYGLQIMNQNNIVHLDIKPGNILFQDDAFKYIDFGITRKMNSPFIKKRSLYEMNTTRIYLYYPYEYIYLYANQKELEQEMEHYNARSNYNIYEFIHKHIFKRNEKKEMIHTIQNIKRLNKRQVIQKLDVYSLGMTITKWLTMILLNGKNDRAILSIGAYFQKPLMKPLLTILKKMTEPQSKNRCTANEANDLFVKLL